MTASRARGPVASPCIGVCRIDPASGHCAGCLRTLDEIATWSSLDDAARRRIVRDLETRRPGPLPVENRVDRRRG